MSPALVGPGRAPGALTVGNFRCRLVHRDRIALRAPDETSCERAAGHGAESRRSADQLTPPGARRQARQDPTCSSCAPASPADARGLGGRGEPGAAGKPPVKGPCRRNPGHPRGEEAPSSSVSKRGPPARRGRTHRRQVELLRSAFVVRHGGADGGDAGGKRKASRGWLRGLLPARRWARLAGRTGVARAPAVTYARGHEGGAHRRCALAIERVRRGPRPPRSALDAREAAGPWVTGAACRSRTGWAMLTIWQLLQVLRPDVGGRSGRLGAGSSVPAPGRFD